MYDNVQPLVGLIDYLNLGDDDATRREVGIAFQQKELPTIFLPITQKWSASFQCEELHFRQKR